MAERAHKVLTYTLDTTPNTSSYWWMNAQLFPPNGHKGRPLAGGKVHTDRLPVVKLENTAHRSLVVEIALKTCFIVFERASQESLVLACSAPPLGAHCGASNRNLIEDTLDT